MGSSDSTPTHLVGPIHTPHTMTSTLSAHLVGKIATPVVGKIATPHVGKIATVGKTVGKIATPVIHVGKIATPVIHVGKIATPVIVVGKIATPHVGKIATPVVGTIHTPHTMVSTLSQAIPAYTNPNHISAISPVHNFHAVPQVNHEDHLTGYVEVPNKGTGDGVVLFQAGVDCSDPTHVAKLAPVANAVVGSRPVYNQCDQLIGHIGAIVKNVATPVSVMLI